MFNMFKKSKSKGEEVTIKIDGMHCTSCSLSIDGALEDIDGVFKSNTSYAKSIAKVEFDSQKVSEEKIKKAIIDEGYKIVD